MDSKLEYFHFSLQLTYFFLLSVGYGWQSCTAEGPFPYDAAVRAGRDADGCTIYVGRAFHESDLLPAKVIPDKQIAYVCHGGEEHPKTEFEILRSGDFVWEFATGGGVPANAIEVGRTADGERLYCGRALHEGTQTPGKVHQIEQNSSANYIVSRTVSFEREKEGLIAQGISKIYESYYYYYMYVKLFQIQVSHGCLYIPFNGEEVSVNEYEVLVLK